MWIVHFKDGPMTKKEEFQDKLRKKANKTKCPNCPHYCLHGEFYKIDDTWYCGYCFHPFKLMKTD